MRTSLVLTSALLCLAPGMASADSPDGPVPSDTVPIYQERPQEASAEPPKVIETQTNRQNDPRLPALLPGETIVTQGGDKMRVWTSAGPVPVNPPPPSNSGVGDVGVLLDGRLIDRRDPQHPGSPPLRPR